MRLPRLRLAAVLLLPVLAACPAPRPTSLLTAVPDSTGRLSYALPADGAERAGALERALVGAVCLLRTGSGRLCRGVPLYCDTRSPAEVAALRDALRPAVARAGTLELRTPSAVDTAVTRHLTGAAVARIVVDSRRATPCEDWGSGACAAFRYGGLWFLVTSDGGDAGTATRADRVTLFPAGQVCRADPRRS